MLQFARRFAKRAKPYATARNMLLTGGGAALLLVGSYSVVFFWPRMLHFSYAGDNCITQPVVLPNLVSGQRETTYRAEPVVSFSMFGYPLYAHTLCVTPIQPPAEHTAETIHFGMPLLAKRIYVSTGAFPALASTEPLESVISTRDPLRLELDSTDRTFGYRLTANDNYADCTVQGRWLECDVASLKLAQSQTYEIVLERMFDGVPAQSLLERKAATAQSIQIVGSSIEARQIVYDAPETVILTLNRAASAAGQPRLYRVAGDQREEVPATFSLEGETVTVRFSEQLARQTAFLLAIENIRAPDGGYLPEPFTLPFETSGGPQVRGVSVGAYRMPRTGPIVLTLDSPVSATQNVDAFVRLEAGGSALPIHVRAHGSTLTITPEGTLPRCTPLTIRVLDGLENAYGVSGGSAWHFNTRTLCQIVRHVGTSVHGRAIAAYHFGTGPSAVVFVGGLHGNEKSSVHTLNSWIEQLEASPHRIPAHRTIVVIPNANPDGYAASTRNNARNVDLNRNFPANDWKPDVTFGDGTHNPTGGGTAPLSEPESSALASYTLGLNPRLVLTYHSIAGYVIPNDSGDSNALAHTYAQHSNLRYASNAQTSVLFPYDTTGAYEDWLHDKHGIPALLIELWTRAGNEFAGNQAAMWHMAGL